MKKVLALLSLLLLLPVVGKSQTTVKNPTAFQFTCADHAQDDAHELQIVRSSDDVVIQVLALGDPTETNGVISGPLNVQPVAFGRYYSRVRAIAGGFASDWSDSSNTWERVPGTPGGVVLQ